MADGHSDYSLMSSLRSSYPNVPLKVVIKVIDTCKRDHEKCKQLLEAEQGKYPAKDGRPPPDGGNDASAFSHANNNVVTNATTKMKELTVSHEPASAAGGRPTVPERHVSTFEKSVVNIPRGPEQPRGPATITKSVSYSGPNAQLSSLGGPPRPPPTSGHTAPPDFAPFFQGIQNSTNIPNITCKTFNNDTTSVKGPGAASNSARPIMGSPSADNANKSFVSSSVTNSPGEHRRPVKVINNPPGSLSGGSVAPGGVSANSRHFKMHFGDTGGTCTVQTTHPAIQRYASSPNVSQHYRSEYRTEASVPQSNVHSSSIVVATSSHSANTTMDRRLSGESVGGGGGSEIGRSTNPFHFSSPNVNAEFHPSPGAYVWEDGRPLSTPVQVSSPGIAHARPAFSDFARGYSEAPYPNFNFIPQHPSAMNYGSQINSDFPSSSYPMLPTSTPEQSYPSSSHFSQQQPTPNHPQQASYHSPPSNLNTAAYNPSTPFSPHFNSPGGIAAYSGQQQQPPVSRNYGHQFTPLNLSGVVGGSSHPSSLPRSPNPGLSQPRLSNRTNSSESSAEHQDGAGDPMRPSNQFSSLSRVSSQSSVGSDSSLRGDRLDRGRSESIHEETEADYIRALLQHQRNCLQKLSENAESHRLQLTSLRSEVSILEQSAIESKNSMHQSFPSPVDIAKMCQKNRQLQLDIQLYLEEIDMYKSGHTPLKDINPKEQQNFYANMPTGQQDWNYAAPNLEANRSSSPSRSPPPRPPPPIPVRQRSTEPNPPGNSDLFNRIPPVPPPQPTTNSGDSEEGEQWSCRACTFQNHPALKKCEMCELERFQDPKPPAQHHNQPHHGAVVASNNHPHQHLPSTLPHRTAAASTAEWVGGVQHHRSNPHHQHHRAGT